MVTNVSIRKVHRLQNTFLIKKNKRTLIRKVRKLQNTFQLNICFSNKRQINIYLKSSQITRERHAGAYASPTILFPKVDKPKKDAQCSKMC